MFYFETKPRQPNPTVYPSNFTPPFPPPKKKKKIHNIISFADRKLGQMHRLTNALDLAVSCCIAKAISYSETKTFERA